jgi:hypothetical protein
LIEEVAMIAEVVVEEVAIAVVKDAAAAAEVEEDNYYITEFSNYQIKIRCYNQKEANTERVRKEE